jgi:hypothetical protein
MTHLLRRFITPCVIAVIASLGLGFPGTIRHASAAMPELPADVVRALREYRHEKGDLPALLSAIVPKVARVALDLTDNAAVAKGGPLSQILSAEQVKTGLDASPGSLPVVIYKQEEGRMPAAWIIARYKRVTPAQVLERISDPRGALKHPLVDQHIEVMPKKRRESSSWGEGAVHQDFGSFLALHMPFGAGMFGMRDSYVMGDSESVLLPNGVALLRYQRRPLSAEERTRFATFADKKGHTGKLDDTHHEAREYMLTSLLIPERDVFGYEHTIHVYFARIVASTKPGTEIKAGGGLAGWAAVRGARDGLVTPVKLIRDEVERLQK